MNNPLISIITVSFNSEKSIKTTIESILNQTYTNIEYIIVDGNSSDKTVEIIASYHKEFINKGIRYRWISEPDAGIYDAMNKGNSLATGDYVNVIGSDDWFELDAMEKVANNQRETSADFIHGNINVYSSSKVFLKVRRAGSRKDMIKEMSFFHPSSFIKKEVIDKMSGYSLEYKICSDYDLILRILNKNFSFSYVNNTLVNVAYGGISTLQVQKALSESHRIRVKNGYNPFLSKFFYFRAVLIQNLKKLSQIS